MKPSVAKALKELAAYCSTAERCIRDVRKKLEHWDIRPEESSELIQTLLKEGFIDERRYSRAFVNDKSKYEKWGPYKIRYELQKRNIPDEIIQESLKGIDPAENQERLIQLLNGKRKSVKGKSEYEINQKLIRFATGRGFLMEDICSVLKTD